MNSRLMFLNVCLALALALVGWRLWDNYQADKALHEAALRRGISATEVPIPAPLDPAKPATAASFLEVAQHMLFAHDRNSNVVIEVEPPPAPPPPPPVPPFPAAFGMMGIGGEVVVLLGDASKQKGYRVGDTVGQFKLSAIKGSDLTFEWNDRSFTKSLDELKKLAATQTAQGADAKPGVVPPKGPSIVSAANDPGQTPQPATPQDQNKTYKSELDKVAGPNAQGSAPERPCSPGDASPPGTIQNGYKKAVAQTPFGTTCIWQRVQ